MISSLCLESRLNRQFHSVGSQTKGLLINADGSVDIYFGPKPPAGKENNWVQTIPETGWNTLLRLYGPLEPWFDKTWRPRAIELLNIVLSRIFLDSVTTQ
jgi:hypothetical protein